MQLCYSERLYLASCQCTGMCCRTTMRVRAIHAALHPAAARLPGSPREQVAFWSAACDPGRDESSLSARLSALTGPRSGLAAGVARQEFLAKCVGLVAGARAPAGRGHGRHAEGYEPGEQRI